MTDGGSAIPEPSTDLRLELEALHCSIEVPREFVRPVLDTWPGAVGDGPPREGCTRLRIEPHPLGWRLLADGIPVHETSAAWNVLTALEDEVERRLLANNPESIALHAGAVRVGDGACLLAGRSRHGKTSSTVQLLELGQAFLCEEIALVDPVSYRVQPYPQSLAVDTGFLDDFATCSALRQGDLYQLRDGIQRYRPRNIERRPVRAETIILPRFLPQAESSSATHLASPQALTEVLEHCFEPRIDVELFYEQVIGLLASVRLLRLIYRNAAEARQLLRREIGDLC